VSRVKKTLPFEVHPFVDAKEVLAGREAKAWSVGPDNTAWWLVDGEPQCDEVLHFADAGDTWERFTLPAVAPDFQYLQPLPGDEVLLVNARCGYRSDAQHERNAHVYSREGVLLRELTLGDGIEDVQATVGGRVWVGYFDEGVFGSNGWGYGGPSTPIGADGLVCFDAWGQRQERGVTMALGLGRGITDCYALNVVSDAETWFYSYTAFPLVRLRAGQPATVWETPVSGAHAIAVSDTHVLFGGTYGDRNQLLLYSLFSKGQQRLSPVARVELADAYGRPWRPALLKGRGPWLHGAEGSLHFRVHLDALVARAAAT
jgi:hypothetical protein